MHMFAGLAAIISPVSAQPQSTIKDGIRSLNLSIRGEFSHYQLDSQRWIVAALTQESIRAKSTKRIVPTPLLITRSNEQIRLDGPILFNVEKLQTGNDYGDVVAVTFCTEMHKFGAEIPGAFIPHRNDLNV